MPSVLLLLLACSEMPIARVNDLCEGRPVEAQGDEPTRFGSSASELAAPLSTIRAVFPDGPLGVLVVDAVDQARAEASWTHSDVPNCHGLDRLWVAAPAEWVSTDGTRWSGTADYYIELDDRDTAPTIAVHIDAGGLDPTEEFLGWYQTWLLEQGVNPVPITNAWMTVQGYQSSVNHDQVTLLPSSGSPDVRAPNLPWTFELAVTMDGDAFRPYP